jgi:hypothetical protein
VYAPETSLTRHAVRAGLLGALAWVWVALFSFPPLAFVLEAVAAACAAQFPVAAAWSGWEHPLAGAARLGIAVLFVVLLAVGVHGPARTGLLAPTTTGWRLTLLAGGVAAAWQAWLGWEVGVARVDIGLGRPDPWLWLAVDAVLLVVEQVYATGAVLALALPLGLPPVDERRRRGLPGLPWLAGLGVGPLQDPRIYGPRTLLAIPVEAWPAILVQAALLASWHVLPVDGDPALALLGGVAAGWLAVRTGSVWPAVVVRLVTSHLAFVAVSLLVPR